MSDINSTATSVHTRLKELKEGADAKGTPGILQDGVIASRPFFYPAVPYQIKSPDGRVLATVQQMTITLRTLQKGASAPFYDCVMEWDISAVFFTLGVHTFECTLQDAEFKAIFDWQWTLDATNPIKCGGPFGYAYRIPPVTEDPRGMNKDIYDSTMNAMGSMLPCDWRRC
jgi:hypothetical protein